ncbi:MAG: hypothetical protein M1820_008676 [Bogoriella megaspora]|nr:MAG: hypothetical protein M1820_008676 [Bogoriella megaspora]
MSVKATSLALLASLVPNAFAGQIVLRGRDGGAQRVDPILAPGKISQHVHSFLGSNGVAPEVTYDSLQNASCTTLGGSINGQPSKQIIEDKSIYWHPALFVKKKGGEELIRVPSSGSQIYYNDHGDSPRREPFEFPKGFRMLAGDPFLRAPSSNFVPGNATQSQNRVNITQWICHRTQEPTALAGLDGGMPDMAGIDTCDNVDAFNGAVNFPYCWNGNDFDPANPTAHMAYAVGNIDGGPCPESHNIRLPHIFMENNFEPNWIMGEFEEDTFMLANGDPKGFGFHADFFNGWKEGALSAILDNCGTQDGLPENCPHITLGDLTDNCNLNETIVYEEDVIGPMDFVPGCNPNTTANPAPNYQVCPLGTSSGTGTLVGGSSNGSSESTDPSSSSSATTSVSSAKAEVASSSATFSASATAADLSTSTTLVSLVKSAESSTTTSTPETSAPSSSHARHSGWHRHSYGVTSVVTQTLEARSIPTKLAVGFAA